MLSGAYHVRVRLHELVKEEDGDSRVMVTEFRGALNTDRQIIRLSGSENFLCEKQKLAFYAFIDFFVALR